MKRRWHQGPAFLKMLINFTDVKIDGFAEIAQKTGAGTYLSNKGDWFPFMKGIPRKALLLHGERKEVLAAFASLQDGYQTETKPGAINKTYLFLVPRSGARQMIGPGAKSIKQIQKEIGVKIEVDDTPADSVISIRGSPSAVKAAVAWLLDEQQKEGGYLNEMREYLISPSYRMDLMHKGDERTEIFVPISRDDVGTVIGEGGANIQHLSYIAKCELRMEWNMRGLDGETMLRIAGAVGDVHTTHKYLFRFLQSKRESKRVSKSSQKATVPT